MDTSDTSAPPPGERAAEIAAALAAVRLRLAEACAAAGRAPDEVALLPVTKFFPESDVRILYALGCREFGESRDQEASAKVAEFGRDMGDGARDVHWHMIGRLQRNKARSVAGWAHTIHSVDSARLASALDRASAEAFDAGRRRAPLRVLLQVSLDDDPGRGGVPIGDLESLGESIESARGLALAGLMAVPPLGSDSDAEFARLEDIHSRFVASFPGATELSAGMTGDLEAAVRHGSTCVRVGTAILGRRPIIST
ncbi:YggS family pyridoxal phosphate-dependent enzyme [Rhodococcus sp. HNM0569]|uniref:YggS family pyridoxal phosphate-dependent enzyme n=1 Tax=Rhodococcus sp. HNM0569 TaxID=2716340 RepID=UPI001469CA1A|nr:YggS family pyridoxal phosphate-dependent enzyme [Rhodococcus sp. HNM0569]